MIAQVEFARHENATLVPLSALVRRNGREGIFLVDVSSLKARFVPVTTGIINGETVEVTEPAVSGLVVTMGNHLIENDSNIMLPPKKQSEKLPLGIRQSLPPTATFGGGEPEAKPVNTRPGDSK